ncbi:MAG: hypothetical protein JXB88_21505 [Spirochaetales bacterium]|nr:hypothetical protein [Spirochaetales bacterium]
MDERNPGMSQAPGSNSSAQNALLVNFSSQQQANTLVRIQTSNSNGILTFMSSKAYQSVAFSSPNLSSGTTYYVYLGGSTSGSPTDGLYQNGTYNPGSQYTSFTVSGKVTTIGGGGGDDWWRWGRRLVEAGDLVFKL